MLATIQPTVHVVDDDRSFLTAVSRLLRASGFAVKTYESSRAFLSQRDADEPGCVVADLQMPEIGGLDLQAALGRARYPLPMLFLTGRADTAATVRAIRGGAEDFLEKRAPKEDLLDAVQRALARDVREREARARQQAVLARFETITVREREVLGHVLQGKLNKQIAGDLGIHERTVKVHRKSIMTKLEVRSVAALARLAQEMNIPASSGASFP
jgi:FixJ family two-component response regulator